MIDHEPETKHTGAPDASAPDASAPEVSVAVAAGRPLPPEVFEREPEPEAKTLSQRFAKLIAV